MCRRWLQWSTAIHVSGVNGRGMESEEDSVVGDPLTGIFLFTISGKVKVPGLRSQTL